MSGGLILGVFTGNHAGAEAPFEAGEYTIGSSLECDVALTDSTLAPRHCSFVLAEDDAVSLAPLEGALTLAGEKATAPLDWPPRTPALAGMVCLAWTRPGEGWAGLKLPSLLTEDEPETPGGPEAEPRGRETAAGDGLKTGAKIKTGDGSGTSGQETARPSAPGVRRLRRLAVPALVVLALIGLIFNFPSSDSPGDLKALEQALRGEGFSELWVERNDGRAMIYGLVPTEVDANRVRGIAAGKPYPIQVILREHGEFSRAILSVLAGHGLFPQVRIENGEAVLLGYALDSLTENAALSWARGAVPQVAPIRSALMTRDKVEETLTAELKRAGGKIAADWRPGVIALSGGDKKAQARVMERVRGALGSPIAFQLAADSEPERVYVGEAENPSGPEALPAPDYAPGPVGGPFGESLTLRSVTPARRDGGEGLPFITTSDGAVYFPGGTLPGGYTLTGIYADRLEFSRNGSTLAYKLQRR